MKFCSCELCFGTLRWTARRTAQLQTAAQCGLPPAARQRRAAAKPMPQPMRIRGYGVYTPTAAGRITRPSWGEYTIACGRSMCLETLCSQTKLLTTRTVISSIRFGRTYE